MMHVPIIGSSCKVTLIIKIHTETVLSLSEKVFPLRTPSHLHLIHEILSLAHPPLSICPRTTYALGYDPRPNTLFGPLTLHLSSSLKAFNSLHIFCTYYHSFVLFYFVLFFFFGGGGGCIKIN